MQEITIKDDFIKLGQLLKLAGLADSGLHWVTNHRVQIMTKYNF